jgi:alpha 1,2-mannosyltransferase
LANTPPDRRAAARATPLLRRATGALLWQDYWASTAAPQLAQMLGLQRAQMPPGSHESGQVVWDKQRHWRGLLLALYLNVHSALFYEVLSCYLGKGRRGGGAHRGGGG